MTWLWLLAVAALAFLFWVVNTSRLTPRRELEEARCAVDGLKHTNHALAETLAHLRYDHLTAKDGGGGIVAIRAGDLNSDHGPRFTPDGRPIYGWPEKVTHEQHIERFGLPHIHLPEPVVLNTGELVNWVCSECIEPCETPRLDALGRVVLEIGSLLWSRALEGGPVTTFDGKVIEEPHDAKVMRAFRRELMR
jgi:hypothetical protein